MRMCTLYVHRVYAWCLQSQKRVLGLLKLALLTVMSYYVGTEKLCKNPGACPCRFLGLTTFAQKPLVPDTL